MIQKRVLTFNPKLIMALIEWEVSGSNYQEAINIPKAQQELAAEDGIDTANNSKVFVRVTNMTTGNEYSHRLDITGNRQLHLPEKTQAMFAGAEKIRLRILG